MEIVLAIVLILILYNQGFDAEKPPILLNPNFERDEKAFMQRYERIMSNERK